MKQRTLKAAIAFVLISMSGAVLADGKGSGAQQASSTAGSEHHHGVGKTVLRTDKIYPPIGPYSQMVAFDHLIFFSGIAPLNLAGNAIVGTTIEEQTRQVLEYIRAGLESQGLTMDDVLSSTVYMKDLNEFAAMNAVYGQYFTTNPPARATIEAARLPRDAKIEISIIAGRR